MLIKMQYFLLQLLLKQQPISLSLLLKFPNEHSLDILDMIRFSVIAHKQSNFLIINSMFLIHLQALHEPLEHRDCPLLSPALSLEEPILSLFLHIFTINCLFVVREYTLYIFYR